MILASSQLYAKDVPSRHPHRMLTTTTTHSGSSPFEPPKVEDTLFVVDTGSGLDTGCTYRNDGPLRIKIKIDRVVGLVDSNGNLSDHSRLVKDGIVSSKAKIDMPAFDIDVKGDLNDAPEVDRVFFNGHDVGTLTGDNEIWKLNSFEVPIEWVKFPKKSWLGLEPTPVENEILINIDEASGSKLAWCMSVDWVKLEFRSLAPVFLIHGTNASSSTWKSDFTGPLEERGVIWSSDIDLTPNGSILGNGKELAKRVQKLAKKLGAKKAHLIAHSKGGLDARAYLNNQYDPSILEILSLYTISTPHHGSILSDITVAGRDNIDPETNDEDIKKILRADYWIDSIGFDFVPQKPAITDQMTDAMATFNEKYPKIPEKVRFYNYGADADLNNNQTISTDEAVPLIPDTIESIASSSATAMYRILGNAAKIKVTKGGRGLWGLDKFTSIEVDTQNSTFVENDLVTSILSAHAPTGTFLSIKDANHSTIKSAVLANEIIDRIKIDYPSKF